MKCVKNMSCLNRYTAAVLTVPPIYFIRIPKSVEGSASIIFNTANNNEAILPTEDISRNLTHRARSHFFSKAPFEVLSVVFCVSLTAFAHTGN